MIADEVGRGKAFSRRRTTGRRVVQGQAGFFPSPSRPSSSARRTGQRKSEPLSSGDRRHLLQLVACGMVFVLLVAAKLLLPDKMAQVNAFLTDSLQQNIDVEAVFSAVGRAFAGDADVPGAAKEVYQAVFHPEEPGEVLEAAVLQTPELEKIAIDSLRPYREIRQDGSAAQGESPESSAPEQASNLAYVLYSQQNLPDNVSLEQAILGFDYASPLSCGALTSDFGYREHPIQGDERFHYGVDLAADTGTAINCFAAGSVTAVGESSSYGRYCMVAHENGYTTLYAHCSRVTAVSGASVAKGEKIAEVGQTGVATGPHLHFELHRNGVYLNPIYYVSAV